ncbi:hypothetical protein FJ941_07555 [Mesorhizobium sp. B2-3-13]|nr:hypothetical protein FJ432_16335 [Mesorhizobium sp. B2-6-5]TPJ84810.1 hypothetical protein FJ434_17680 [Mesorhizobium sp. B2-5-13]TPK50955.1 hypothetical protein FJ560_11750 [Mesorhizobium sp. B2-5-5]TPL85198.1 hypothetical protein FJ941_07555 [Mesorhizobium sp. B2-3-13]
MYLGLKEAMSVDLRWKHIRAGMYFIIERQAATHLTEIGLPKAESSVSAIRFGTLWHLACRLRRRARRDAPRRG